MATEMAIELATEAPGGAKPAPQPGYPGPKQLTEAFSAFALAPADGAQFVRDGPRADNEYRDLGLAAATGGRMGMKHIRAIMPFPRPTGWHWHDLTAHYVYVLRGSLTFRFAGVDGEVTVHAGSGLSQPAGVPHNVVARSDDLEVLELNVPAHYGTYDLDAPADAEQPWPTDKR